MTIDVKKQTESIIHLMIQDEMTIYNVLEQKHILLPYLEANKELQLDLSEVTEIDSAGMQLLIMLKQQALKINNQFSLVHHSQAVVEVLGLLNLASFFGDPVIMPADWDVS
ncbi:MAG: STAS domain-containing protein [Piscirickettsiaceae bacterium]|nr:STAS domain-containing protein [Piscirickettsiaceae bacterium]